MHGLALLNILGLSILVCSVPGSIMKSADECLVQEIVISEWVVRNNYFTIMVFVSMTPLSSGNTS